MKKVVFLVLLLVGTSASVFGQCKDTLRAMSSSSIALSLCPKESMPKEKDLMIIAAGGGQIETEVKKSTFTLGTQLVEVELTEPAKAQENMLLLIGIDTATVRFSSHDGGNATQPPPSFTVAVQQGLGAQNFYHYNWSVGPATKGNQNGETTKSSGPSAAADPGTTTSNTDSTGAIRLRYTGDYASGGLLGKMKSTVLQTTASLSVDTTDQKTPDFIDNNRASLGMQLTNLSFGRLWMHGQVGVEGRLEKAFHQDVRNVDAVLTASGWVPVLRSFTLFSPKGEFIAAPLSFKASYGYRDRHQSDESLKGRVFEGSALYHLFLLEQYQISFSATLTHNDLDHQPASIPRTQRLYKATISYLANPESGFKVLTSIEDGSAGVMLRKVRQYFIGIAFSKLDLSGSGGS